VTRDVSRWPFLRDFEAILGSLRAPGWPALPLCPDCSAAYCQLLKFRCHFFADTNRYLTSVAVPDARRPTEALEQLNDRVARDTAVLVSVARQCACNAAVVVRAPAADAPAHHRLARRASQIHAGLAPRAALPCPFSLLTLASAFRISTRRHYGCINGSRLGTGTPDAVAAEEFDRALLFLAQLLVGMGRLTGVEPLRPIAVGVGVSFADPERGSVALTCADVRRKRLPSFHQGVTELVALAALVFASRPFAETKFNPHTRSRSRGRSSAGSPSSSRRPHPRRSRAQ
jgi:hypothetical protein